MITFGLSLSIDILETSASKREILLSHNKENRNHEGGLDTLSKLA